MGHYSVFVEAGVPLSVIALTRGENGIPNDDHITTSEEMGRRREIEFRKAITSFGGEPIQLGFPDMGLTSIWNKDPNQIIEPVLEIIRRREFGALLSFHPYEITPQFDHPDHRIAGLVVQIVAASADVAHYFRISLRLIFGLIYFIGRVQRLLQIKY